ncbi:lytic polysaccharide monooxygenase (plasmid) [Pseudoalteromonas sp. CF6-2]|uniref:Lytic chitin monooxygenase n=1 Tax=Pseudoalteromonas sp. CF6-2 TaxID=562716 RepID=A0A7D5JVI4_9GAMM|nr:lytic chitin monooxygenase [Pseudoalteromonas sp. CF6-2]UJX27569.1 lytic polysaccharide monooxygenase [Pseudoalteromonas sp. CF6-2]
MKIIKSKALSLSALASTMLLGFASSHVNAHGFLESPKARQAICNADGGYWWPDDGSGIPNLACRAAFVESGHVQFVQDIEFSANTADYTNIAAVKQSVPDGALCAAGDSAKRGMDLPSPHWQRSDVIPNANGDILVRFLASTPHNPSFWEFYLTKPGFDGATQVLTWNDLELVAEYGNLDFVIDANNDRYYEMSVSIPAGRSGDAILYTRWQREDAGGEGFYNCSDITIVTDAGPTDSTNWSALSYFVRQGQDAVVGGNVSARLFDEAGQELVTQQMQITSDNQANWQQAFAELLNLNYSHLLQVGVQSSDGSIAFNANDVLTNQVFATNASYSFALSVQAAPENTAPIVHQPDDLQVNENSSTKVHLHAFDDQQSTLTYSWNVPAPLSFTGTGADITIVAPEVNADTSYTVTASVSDGELTTQTRFVVNVLDTNTTPTEPSVPAWDSMRQYNTGDQVSFGGGIYSAKWWNQGAQPDSSDAWQLEAGTASEQWTSGKAYQGSAEVIYQGKRYRAQWWTQGDVPSESQVWTEI